MRLHRFIGQFDCSEETVTITDADVVNQIGSVLRLGVGDRLILGDGNGNECVGEISDRKKNEVSVTVIERSINANDPAVFVTLYCAILKRENFELVVQKATELGVSAIVPLVTTRTVKLDIKEDRLRKIITEAGEQSGRARLPVLHKPMRLTEAFEHARGNDANFFFTLADADASDIAATAGVRRGLFVGPEGGWTEEEDAAAREAGHTLVSLGALTLRGETAAIIASYLGTRD